LLTKKHKRIFRLLGRRSRHWGSFDLTDPRDVRGRRYSLALLLRLVWLAMLTAQKNLRAVEHFSERMLGRRISDTRLATLLPELSVAELEDRHRRQVLDFWRSKALEANLGVPFNVVAIDGKSVWVGKTQTNEYCQEQTDHARGLGPQWVMRVVRAVVTSSRVHACIAQMPVPAATNEMGAFPAFWAQLLESYGHTDMLQIATVDNGYTSRENATLIHDSGRDYVMALKGPQQELLAEAQRLLAEASGPDGEPDFEAETCDKRDGKLIVRQLWRTSEAAGYLDWSHLRQIWLVRQTTTVLATGEVSEEDRFFLTSLEAEALTGPQVLALVRSHWHVENDCNWVIDTQWKEDDCPWVATGTGLLVVTLLRLMAFNVLQLLRNRTLRSESSREMAWAHLLKMVDDALLLVRHGVITDAHLALLEVVADNG
jgi:hypothetical protein